MNLKATRLMRRPFGAIAYQVTEENMAILAHWCEGSIIDREDEPRFIRVPVVGATHRKKTDAYVGRWIVMSQRLGHRTFRVYRDEWIENDFIILSDDEWNMGGEISEAEQALAETVEQTAAEIHECCNHDIPRDNVRALRPTPNSLPPAVRFRTSQH